jgi:hypothetical protein
LHREVDQPSRRLPQPAVAHREGARELAPLMEAAYLWGRVEAALW